MQCGLFLFTRTDFLALNNLDIPCRNEVVISLVELDKYSGDDSYAIRVPCTSFGPVSMELKIAAFKVTGVEDTTVNAPVKDIMDKQYLNAVAYASLKIVTAAS